MTDVTEPSSSSSSSSSAFNHRFYSVANKYRANDILITSYTNCLTAREHESPENAKILVSFSNGFIWRLYLDCYRMSLKHVFVVSHPKYPGFKETL